MIGYEALGDDGSGMRVLGALQTDEVYTGESLAGPWNPSGTVNVSAMWRDILANRSGARARTAAMTESLFDALVNKDLDVDTLARMTLDKATVPLILIARADGQHSLVDGTHRLAWLRDNGAPSARFWEFPERAISRYRVDISVRAAADAPWVMQTPAMLFSKVLGTYAQFDAAGNVIGIRDERKKA